jgi:hypothetical protein
MTLNSPLARFFNAPETRLATHWRAYLVAVVFFWAALYKVTQPQPALRTLARFHLSPELQAITLFLISVTECFLALNIVCNYKRALSISAVWILLLCFTLFLLSSAFDSKATCGCTGIELLFGQTHAFAASLIRNVVLLFVSGQCCKQYI